MSFLSIAFLAALPLAAAPILLHLFDRRRNVRIEWGAMQFLMEATTRKTSARKFRQYLLLLFRVLAVAALIFALARPMAPGNWFGGQERCETVLVIDNSMSMMRVVDGRSLFEQAVQRSIDKLDDSSAGDAVRILVASPYPVWATNGSLRIDPASRPSIETQLRKLVPTQGRSDLLSALMTAAQAELDPTQKRRKIVVYSDAQAADWHLDDSPGWQQFSDILRKNPIPTELEFIQLEAEPSQVSNLAVNQVQTLRTVVGVNQPFSLSAQVQNYGHNKSKSTIARWTIPGEVPFETPVEPIEGGAVHDVVWKHSLAKPGVYPVTCNLESNDDLMFDNGSTCVLEVVDKVPIVVVESASDKAELQQDSFFFQAALGWTQGEPLDNPSVFVPTIVTPQRLETLDLGGVRAVVIPNLTDLSEAVVKRLDEFVVDGGGLWIGLGPRTDSEFFNQFLFADGQGPAPLAIDRMVEEASTGHRKTTINPFVKEHPATQELTNNQQLDTGDVVVTQRYRFLLPPAGEEPSVLLGLTNGEPLAVEKFHGRGRVVVQSIPLRLQWSRLAKSQAFVVMVQDWLAYLTQPKATRHNLAPGDPISIHVADLENPQATLKTPHGDSLELSGETVGNGVVFRSTRTILPGSYELELGISGDTIPFQVQRDPVESNLARLDDRQAKQLAEVAGLSGQVTETATAGSYQGEPLWPMLLLAVVGAMLAELVLSGLISRQRFETEAIAETTEPWAGTSSLESTLNRPKALRASAADAVRAKPHKTLEKVGR